MDGKGRMDTARLPSAAINLESAEEMLIDLAETTTRIEGAAQHMRGTIRRLRERLEADRAAQAGGEDAHD